MYRQSKKLLTIILALVIIFLLAGCGQVSGGGSRDTGKIAGTVRAESGEPLDNVYEEETMLMVLFCPGDKNGVECLQEDMWDMESDDLINAICDADEDAARCLAHLGETAAVIEEDGRYTLEQVPEGEFGLVFIFRGPGLTQISLKRDLDPVTIGETVEYDFDTTLSR